MISAKIHSVKAWLIQPVDSLPLAVFRIALGALLLLGGIRFWANGWIDEQFIQPDFLFSFYGFEWVQRLPEAWMMKGLYGVMLLSFVGLATGKWYRASAITGFTLFSYFELLDKTNYLNHYYFVMLLLLLMALIPAHKATVRRKTMLPRWTIFIIQLQFAILYVHAGLAKVHWEWVVDAMPLRIWLPAHMDVPVVGQFMDELWVAYFFSYFGLVYDLLIPFGLWWKKTRKHAYLTVIAFHMTTWLLFPIGMFPFIMMVATTVFFTGSEWRQMLAKVGWRFDANTTKSPTVAQPWLKPVLATFFTIQVLLPWRFLLYPGELFWREEGYRFSWRVMLMEKAGAAEFIVEDPSTGKSMQVRPCDHLTPNQEKMMATQPDMILQYAHFLDAKYREHGIEDPVIKANVYVALNGRPSQRLIDPNVDLSEHEESFAPKPFILALNSQPD